MQRGWILLYEDGSVLRESEADWRTTNKKGISALRLRWHDRVWEIKGQERYIQFKSGSVTVGQTEPTIHSRCIGYLDNDGGGVVYRVEELTGRMKIETLESGKGYKYL